MRKENTQVNDFIYNARKNGDSYKDIAVAIKDNFGINLTAKACCERLRYVKKKAPEKPTLSNLLTETDLRKRHDNAYKITKVASEIKEGVFVEEQTFIQQCKIKQHAGYRRIIERPEYDQYHGKADGLVYWGHPKSIKKMKQEGILI